MFQMLSLPYIRRWLAGLIKKGLKKTGDKIRHGPTLPAIARYTGIPKNTLIWLAKKDTANLGADRVRIMSKMIAEIENGILDFEVSKKGDGYRRKVAVRYDKPGDRPRARQKYQVAIGASSPKLTPVDRPKVPGKMPTMKDLLGK